MDNTKLLNEIKEGKWFKVIEKNDVYLVKMKSVQNTDEKDTIDALWLSATDTEAITINEYSKENWDVREGILHIFGSSTFHVGSFDGEKDSIYDENSRLSEMKMKNVVMNNVSNGFITENELNNVWNDLLNKDLDKYGILQFDS